MKIVCTICNKDLTVAGEVLGSAIEVKNAHEAVHRRQWQTQVIDYLLVKMADDLRAEKLYDMAKELDGCVVVM